jgi:tetratricopeptide (TPR) repeat protein
LFAAQRVSETCEFSVRLSTMVRSGSATLPTLLAALKIAVAHRDRQKTNQIVTQLLDRKAPLGKQWKAVSQLMQVSGELTLATRSIDAFIAAAGNQPMARYAKVVLLTQAQRSQEAHDLLAQLPDDVPDPSGRAYVLGNTAMTLGRIDEARAFLLKAIALRPGWGPAWLSLATAENLSMSRVGDQLLAEAPLAEKQSQADLARFCYALGKLHADRGDPAAAFSAFARGAALLKSQTAYNRSANVANAKAAVTGYSDAALARLREHQTVDTRRPIFVTGLPRSGTTLVEQILASHSEVSDGGELNIIQHLAVAVGSASADAVDQYLARGGSLRELGELYLHLLSERSGPIGRVVDKTIDASRFMGIISAALPNAPLIWMQRAPLDNAWSCFRTFFIHGVGWSFDLADIAHHFQLEDQLLSFWKSVLGDRLMTVPYAGLVEAPAMWTSRLLQHCGLSDESAAYAPHLTQRRVATASSLQVRRPINRDGLGVSEPYNAFMRPFIDTYQPR